MHNLPIPFIFSNGVMSEVLTSYRLEADAIAVNTQRTNFVLLTEKGAEGCSKPVIGFCSVKSPVYPISSDRFCITGLFIKDKERTDQTCQTVIRLKRRPSDGGVLD